MALVSITINKSTGAAPGRHKRALLAVAAVAVVGIGAGTAAAVADSSTPSAYVATTPTFLYSHTFGPSAGANTAVSGGGVPSNATAVQISLTASAGTADGSAFVFPTGGSKPGTANVTWVTGKTSTTELTVPIGSGGDIRFMNGAAGTVTLKAIVVGYYTSAPLPTAFQAVGTSGTTIGTTRATVASLSLPVGNFLVSAKTTVANTNDTADDIGCFLYKGSSNVDAGYGQVDLNGQADGQTVISVQGVMTSANNTITLQCVDTTNNAYAYVPTITAVQVGSISNPFLAPAHGTGTGAVPAEMGTGRH